MASASRFARVGSGSGGTGLAILELSNGSTLSIFIVPKFWGPSGCRADIDLDALLESTKDQTLVVPELATLRLLSRDEGLLAFCMSKLLGLKFDEEMDDDDLQEPDSGAMKRTESLLVETVRPVSFDLLTEVEVANDTIDESIRRFWSNIEDIKASDLVKLAVGTDLESPVLLGRRLIRAIPGLEMALWRLFVSETEHALRRRTPDFRARREVLPFVRGALTRAGRFNASVGDRTRLECEFSELDHDHDWQRLIRAGVRETSRRLRAIDGRHGEAELLLRCRRIDIRMSDVQVVDRPAARRINIDISRLGKNRHAIYAARLASAVLGGPIDVGRKGRNPRDVAIATGLRVSSPHLFERMLAGSLNEQHGFQLVANREALALRKGEPARKRPDLLLVNRAISMPSISSSIALVDAKYKLKAPAALSQMPMGDQYQQFAYAVVSGRPTLFLYAAAPGTLPELVDSGLANVASTAPILALGSVPFPGPDEESWRFALGSSLQRLIADFTRLIESRMRQSA